MFRSWVASVCGLVAAVLLPLSVLSVWAQGVVSDTDTYVETVTPLADDDVVKAAAVQELQRQALQLAATSGTPLPPGTDRLVHRVVEHVVDSATFRSAWVQANRTAHEQLVAVLEDRGGALLDSQGRITLDLNPVLEDVALNLADQGLAVPAPTAIDASFAVMDADQVAKARRTYTALDTLGSWLPLVWAALVLLTLLLARRRLGTTARLAAASLLTLGLLALMLLFARDALTEDLPQRDVALAVWDIVVASLWHAIKVCAAALALVALATAVLAKVRGRTAAPPGTDPDGARAYG